MDKLGVGYVPGPYETCPWSHGDAASGVTCSAELRMGGGGDEAEAEIQLMYESPPAGKPPMEQVFALRFIPAGDGMWTAEGLRIRGEPYGADLYDPEDKGCAFFRAVVRELAAGRIPDIDALIDEAFHGGERFADQHGGGGGKSPKIKPGQLLNMKQGRGF